MHAPFDVHLRRLGALIGLALLAAPLLQAQPASWTIHYQGFLTDTRGTPVDTSGAALTFRLYETEDGSSPVWTETQTGVRVSAGVFSVELGRVESLSSVPFDRPLWLSVAVGDAAAEELVPRVALGAVPFSVHAETSGLAERLVDGALQAGDNISITEEDGRLVIAAAGADSASSPWTTSGDHVVYDGGGLLASGAFGDGTIPAEGPGTRLMWYPGKAAFRAGRISADAARNWWNDENVGPHSMALGLNPRASGYAATALGFNTHAAGFSATAVGYDTKAAGLYTFSAGNRTEARAYASTALGQFNAAGGDSANWVETDPLFVVGNGRSASNRSNALTLLKNGDLTVSGTIASTAGGFKFPDGTVQTTAATGGSGTNLPFIVDDENRVGLGTSTPEARLDVRSTSGRAGSFIIPGGNTTNFNTALYVENSAQGGAGDFRVTNEFNSHAAISAAHATRNGTAAYFFGNVGIGDNFPNADLHIADPADAVLRLEGNAQGGALGGARIELANDGSVRGRIRHNGQLEIVEEDGQGLVLGTNNQERLRILPDGNVGIGTSSPSAALHLRRSASEVGLKMRASNSWTAEIKQTDASVFSIHNGGRQTITIYPDGRVHINGSLSVNGAGTPVAYGQTRGLEQKPRGFGFSDGVWKESLNRWEFTLTGIDFNSSDYIVVATPRARDPRFVMYGSISDKLLIEVFNQFGAGAYADVSFIVYKP